ncbi:MAG: hypothetical protein CM1200mP28_11990 [Deltaproteobacteria bacterium]|nr:MAG: hypothetical protein CM1200mP28_11990 [Deltaproteobacteria bacterium]
MAVLSALVISAGVAFFKYNSPPALIYMGDLGALALGSMVSAMFIFVKADFSYQLWEVLCIFCPLLYHPAHIFRYIFGAKDEKGGKVSLFFTLALSSSPTAIVDIF